VPAILPSVNYFVITELFGPSRVRIVLEVLFSVPWLIGCKNNLSLVSYTTCKSDLTDLHNFLSNICDPL